MLLTSHQQFAKEIIDVKNFMRISATNYLQIIVCAPRCVADPSQLTPPPARYSHAHPISIDKHCFFAPVFTCRKHVLVCLSNPRVGQPSLTVSLCADLNGQYKNEY